MSVATDSNSGKIYMINRNNYNTIVERQEVDSNSIYLVRENSKENCKFISMYLGEAIQADVLDITDDITYNEQEQHYNIPIQYRVGNKLYLHKDGDFFRVFSWSETDQMYVDCLGSNSNVQVVSVDDTSEISNPVTNYVYVNIRTGNRNIYVYDGTDFVPVVDTSTFITNQALQETLTNYAQKTYVDNKTNIDNITILRDGSNKLYGAGANVYGKTMRFNSEEFQTLQEVTGSTGSHIYNNYNFDHPLYNNAASGLYSNAFGYGARALGYCSFAAGVNVAVGSNAQGAVALGRGIHVNTDGCCAVGSYNKAAYNIATSPSGNETHYAFVVGNGTDVGAARSDALTVDKTGNVVLYGDRTVSQGNIKTSTGVSLATIRDAVSGSVNTQYVDDYLPENGYEVQLSNSSNSYAEITNIKISNIAKVIDANTNRTSDYSCTYIFRKAAATTTAETLMVNFTSTNETETTVSDEPPKINLLNPDLDISGFNVIHIFIFYDGISMCAIVGGYNHTFPVQP